MEDTVVFEGAILSKGVAEGGTSQQGTAIKHFTLARDRVTRYVSVTPGNRGSRRNIKRCRSEDEAIHDDFGTGGCSR